MKAKILFLILLSIAVFIPPVYAVPGRVTIRELHIDENGNLRVYITGGGICNPAVDWIYVLKTDDQHEFKYALLLSAFLSGKKVAAELVPDGGGNCHARQIWVE